MTVAPAKAATDLAAASQAFAASHGSDVLVRFDAASAILVDWLQYLAPTHATSPAAPLLAATISAIKEAAGCLALGLVRPALFAMRSEYDIIYAWIFLHTHPIEWERARQSGEGFPLRGEVHKYVKTFMPDAWKRFELLQSKRNPDFGDPYDILSVHVHSKTELALPAFPSIKDIVSTKAKVDEAVEMQRRIAVHVSDLLLSLRAREWPALPALVRTDASGRLTPAQLAILRA